MTEHIFNRRMPPDGIKGLEKDLPINISDPQKLMELLVAFTRQKDSGSQDLFSFAGQWAAERGMDDNIRSGDILRSRAVALYEMMDKLPKAMACRENNLVTTSLLSAAAVTPIRTDENGRPTFDQKTLEANAALIEKFVDENPGF